MGATISRAGVQRHTGVGPSRPAPLRVHDTAAAGAGGAAQWMRTRIRLAGDTPPRPATSARCTPYALATVLMLAQLAAFPAEAKDGLRADATFRARVEAIDGQPRATGAHSDAALLLRTNIFAEYTTGPLAIGGELVDSRSYFEAADSSVSTSEVNTLEPLQAYVRYAPAKSARLQVGRFTMDLGSRRLIARNGFRNTINGFTGARLDLGAPDDTSATLFWMLPQTRLPADRRRIADNAVELDRERTALQIFGAFVTRKATARDAVELYAYRLAERDAPDFATRDRRLVTVGARARRLPAAGYFDYDVEGAYQTGTQRNSLSANDRTDHDVAAGFFQASIGYSFATAWSPRFAAGYDYASGDRGDAAFNRFDTLFGARSADFGPTSLMGAVARANLSSPSIRLELTPDKRWDGQFTLRGLWLASATDSFGGTGVRDPSGASGRHAGTQFDARVRHWLIPKRFRLAVGGVVLAKGRFLRDAPNAPATGDTHYGYVETTFSF